VQEEDLADEALLALQAISEKVSRGQPQETEGSLTVYLKPVIKECLERLREPQHKQAKPAATILAAVSKPGPAPLFAVVKATFPSFLSLYQDADTIEKRRSLLDPLLLILQSAESVQSLGAALAESFPVIPFKDRLFEIFSQALMGTIPEEVSFRVLALKCLLTISTISGVLESSEVGLVVQYFNEILTTEDDSGRSDLKDNTVEALLELSKTHCDLISTITIPTLMIKLPDTGSPDVNAYGKVLEVLARLSTRSELSELVIRRLFSRLDAALSHSSSSSYCESLLSTLLYCFDSRKDFNEYFLAGFYRKIIELVKGIAHAAINDLKHPLLQDGALRAFGRLTSFIFHKSDTGRQHEISQHVYNLFTESAPFITGSSLHEISESRRLTIILSTYFLTSLDAKVSDMHILDNLTNSYRLTSHSILENLEIFLKNSNFDVFKKHPLQFDMVSISIQHF
jgi:DNA repair/transcription protein MET18/MMS19